MGKQIVVVGEFLQLRPLPSLFDFMFLSLIFYLLNLDDIFKMVAKQKYFLVATEHVRKCFTLYIRIN